jgi:hypothetical protein
MPLPAWLVEFEVAKQAVVRDARLGLLWWVLALAVLVHTGGNVLASKGWLEFEPPSGTVQARLLPPLSLSQPPEGRNGMKDTEKEEAPYYYVVPEEIEHEGEGEGEEGRRRAADREARRRARASGCVVWDEFELSELAASSANDLFITTMLRDRIQVVVQDGEEEGPAARRIAGANLTARDLRGVRYARRASDPDETFFTLTPEKFLVRFDHAVFATRAVHPAVDDVNAGSHGASADSAASGLAESSKHMRGRLLFRESVGVAIPPLELPAGENDVLSLETLLDAAGVDLDHTMCDVADHANDTVRECGAVLHVTIEYQNVQLSWWGGISEPWYTVRVTRLPETEFKSSEIRSRWNDDDDGGSGGAPRRRSLRVRHGVKLHFLQLGRLAYPSIATLLINISSGVGLISIVTIVVDQLGIYFLEGGARYYSGTRDVVDSQSLAEADGSSGTVHPTSPSVAETRAKRRNRKTKRA